MGADGSFEEFWSARRDRIGRALALTLNDAALAFEAVDEAMTRAYARWGRVGELDDPSGWVFRVGLNWARSALRKRRLRPIASTQAVERSEGAAEVTGASREVTLDLWQAVVSLPVKQREVLVLRFYLDWSIERIAGALELPAGTVKSRLHRGLQTLHKHQGVRT